MFISFHDCLRPLGYTRLYTHAVMVTTLSVASWSPDVVLNVIVFIIPWVSSKKGSSNLGNACWYSDCNNSACGHSRSPDVLNVIVFSITWVLSKKGSSSLGNACWYSDCNNSACGQSHSPVSLAGAVTSIIFVETKVLSWQTRYNTTKLCLSWTNICCDKTFVVTSILLLRQKMCLSWQK